MVSFIYLVNDYTQKPVCKVSRRKQNISFRKKEHMLYLNASKDVIVGDPQDKCWYFNNDKVLTVYILC